MDVQIDTMSLKILVGEVFSIVRLKAQEKNFKLNLEQTDGTDQVHADEKLLHKVLLNLVNNG